MIRQSQTKFGHYLKPHPTLIGEAKITDDEIKEALRSLKLKKSPRYDNISSSVVNEALNIFFTLLKYIFNLSLQQRIFPENLKIAEVNETLDIFFTLLKYIFNLSLQQGIFPENLKIEKVSLIYKKDEEFLLANYRPILVFPCFSKLLEWIIYNGLFKYLSENSILYENQFGFQTSHSTEHAILLLVNQIY